MLRTEIDSMPAELDELTRRVMRLEIEEAALGQGETTRPARRGWRTCARSWPTCAPRPTPCAPSGRPSGRRCARCRRCARRSSRSGRRPRRPSALRPQPGRRAAPRRAARAGAAAARRGGAARSQAGRARRLLREVVTEEEIADDRVALDRHPGQPAAGGRAGEAAAPRRDPARAGRRPGRGGAAGRRRDHPGPLGHQGPAPADRIVHLPRARPGSARPSWPRRWRRRCSTPRRTWSAST